MVDIPTKPTITCGITESPIAVVATYAGGVLPISNAKVTFKAAFFGYYGGGDVLYTNFIGIAQKCYSFSVIGLGIFIQKDGVDFGDGTGNEHFIGDTGIRTGPWFKNVVAKTLPPGYKPPVINPECIGAIYANPPDFQSILANISTFPPPPIYVGISSVVNGSAKNVPIKINVSPPGKDIAIPGYEADISNRNIDVVATILSAESNPENLKKAHTITIGSSDPNCKITPAVITVPALIPGFTEVTPCIWKTEAFVDMPPVLKTPFDISISGAKWICDGVPTPIGGISAEVFIGAMKFYIPLSAGSGSLPISLSDIQSVVSGGVGSIPNVDITLPKPSECDKFGNVNNAAELQAWLTACYPEKGLRVEGGPTLWKIRRPSGSYFWGNKYQDIRGVLGMAIK